MLGGVSFGASLILAQRPVALCVDRSYDRHIVRRVTFILLLVAVAMGTIVQPSGATEAGVPTARQVVLRLKALGIPIGAFKTYTVSSDENHLLGRPGQYTSKVNFRDTRLPAAKFDISGGGSVEVFASNADAQRRYKYVHAVTQSASMFVEYEYLDGRVFLRLSSTLTPQQAKAYAAALKHI